jgi:hypothetical protein
VIRNQGDSADEVVIAGYGNYSDGPSGIVTVWSAVTMATVLRVEEHSGHQAGA